MGTVGLKDPSCENWDVFCTRTAADGATLDDGRPRPSGDSCLSLFQPGTLSHLFLLSHININNLAHSIHEYVRHLKGVVTMATCNCRTTRDIEAFK